MRGLVILTTKLRRKFTLTPEQVEHLATIKVPCC